MVILHSADWHLGKRLENFSRLQEQIAFLDEFCQIADDHHADIILLAGDIYDHYVPSNESAEQFYKALRRLSRDGDRPVVVIAGNHDSPDHLLAPEVLARTHGVALIGYPRQPLPSFVTEKGISFVSPEEGMLIVQVPGQPPVRLIATPYANAIRLRTMLDPLNPELELAALLKAHWAQLASSYCDDKGVNILMTHLFMAENPSEPAPEPEDEKPILYVGGIPALGVDTIPPGIQYVALGHLHRPHHVHHQGDFPVVYAGSPISYSFSEAAQQKSVVLIEIQPDTVAQYHRIALSSGYPLLRYRTDNTDSALEYLATNQDAYIELTMVFETYLSGDLKMRLESAHPRLFIVPESKKTLEESNSAAFTTRLDQIDEVFSAFFKEQKGVDPDEALWSLFHELLNEEMP